MQSAFVSRRNRKKALLAVTRKNLEREKQDWQAHMEAERDRFIRELHSASAETLYQLLLRRALRDLADDDLEAHIALNVMSRLKSLSEGADRRG